jgi:methenyltetrahydromethanopterin cyclohydrolase
MGNAAQLEPNRKLAARPYTEEDRLDVTAQPYGMNTTVIFITLYAMSLPALEMAQLKFNPGVDATTDQMQVAARNAAEYGWKVSVAVNFIIGIFEVGPARYPDTPHALGNL